MRIVNNVRDYVGLLIVACGLQLASKSQREHVLELLDKGRRYRRPAPRVNPKWRER